MLRLLRRRRYNEGLLKRPWKESWWRDGDGGHGGVDLAYIWLRSVVVVGLNRKGRINCCPLNMERYCFEGRGSLTLCFTAGNNHTILRCNRMPLCTSHDQSYGQFIPPIFPLFLRIPYILCFNSFEICYFHLSRSAPLKSISRRQRL